MPEFKAGDKVQWTRKPFSSQSIPYTTMNATVVGMHDEIPHIVICKFRNGKIALVHAKKLRMQGERSELTEAILRRDKGPDNAK